MLDRLQLYLVGAVLGGALAACGGGGGSSPTSSASSSATSSAGSSSSSAPPATTTTGLGAVGPTAIELPQSQWCCATAEWVAPPVAATALQNEALVVGTAIPPENTSLIQASVFTNSGNLLRSTLLPNLSIFGNGSQLFSTGNTTALLVGVSYDAYGHPSVNLQNLDDTPAAVGTIHTISLSSTNENVADVWDGQELWVMWNQSFGITGAQLMLQPFDTNGNALAPAQVLDTISEGAAVTMHAAGANGSALLTWADASLTPTYRYAAISGNTGMAQVFTLGASGQGYTGEIDSFNAPVPVLGSGVAALLGRGPIFSYTASGPLPDNNPRGVLLSSQFQPLRNTTGSLDQELLPSTWALPTQPFVVAALGGRLMTAGYAYQQQLSSTSPTVDILYTGFVSPGSTPLATAALTATSFNTPGDNWSGGIADTSSEMPSQILLWPDRALVVGSFATFSVTGAALTLVWLN